MSHAPRYASICTAASDLVADTEGFVSVRALIEHFGVELVARPLLYEGMVAAPKKPGDRWLVLVDDGQSGYANERYLNEHSGKALPARVRFTIAHELSHVIQLRDEMAKPKAKHKKGHESTLEDQLESEADALSPILLISYRDFEKRFASGDERLTLARLLEARQHWAVSREALLNRLKLLEKYDPRSLRFRPALRDIAVGIGQWNKGSGARIPFWPRPFTNFSENLTPSFLLTRKTEATENLTSIFSDPGFSLNKGPNLSVVALVDGGTQANPACERMEVRLTVEKTPPVPDGKFLFIVERI